MEVRNELLDERKGEKCLWREKEKIIATRKKKLQRNEKIFRLL